MAAGLGFKDFVTGEVLTAADVDGYLMQGVWVFASAAARDAAVTSPQEGNFAYLKDTNVTTYYTGSAWANLDTTGMTNPMTTTGDTIYSSSGSTPARLGIGTTGQVLTVAGGVPSWATAGGGGSLTKITSAPFTTQSTVDVDDCFTSTYTKYLVLYSALCSTTASLYLQYRYAGPTTQTTTYYGAGFSQDRSNAVANYGFDNVAQATISPSLNTAQTSIGQILFDNVGNSSQSPVHSGTGHAGDGQKLIIFSGLQNTSRTYTGFRLSASSGTITGTYAVYGYTN
jgi:hypothetical protein